MLTHVIVILGSLWAACLCGASVPTPRQYEYMEMGFTQFMHLFAPTGNRRTRSQRFWFDRFSRGVLGASGRQCRPSSSS